MNILICKRSWNARARQAFFSFALMLTGACLSTAYAAEVSGTAKGGTFQPYPINGIPLLDSFFFRFRDHEMDVQAIEVEPASTVPNPCEECSSVPAGQIYLAFQDDDVDEDEEDHEDEYFYRVSHASVPEGVFRHRTFDNCKGTCGQWLNRPSRDYVFVITGFHSSFRQVTII